MEILLTFLAEVDFAFNDRPKSVLGKCDASVKGLNSSMNDVRSTLEIAEEILENDAQSSVEFSRTTLPVQTSSANQHARSHSCEADYSASRRRNSESRKKDRRYGQIFLIKNENIPLLNYLALNFCLKYHKVI